jgi:hypothetical protein
MKNVKIKANIALTDEEYNLLQAALDHMNEHLEHLIDEDDEDLSEFGKRKMAILKKLLIKFS